jgi:hypothetical protein
MAFSFIAHMPRPVSLFLPNITMVDECRRSLLSKINRVDSAGFIDKGRSEAFGWEGRWGDLFDHFRGVLQKLEKTKQKNGSKVGKVESIKLKTGHEKFGGTI